MRHAHCLSTQPFVRAQVRRSPRSTNAPNIFSGSTLVQVHSAPHNRPPAAHAESPPHRRAFRRCVPLQAEPVAKKARLDLETSLASVATARPPTGRGTPTRAGGYPRCPIKGLGDTNSLARNKPPPLNLGRADRPPTPTEDDGVRRSARLSTSIPE